MFRSLHTLARTLGLTVARCPVCGLMTAGLDGELCPTCAEELAPRTTGYCPQCGEVFGDENAPPTQCAACRHDPPPWDILHFYGTYSGPLRQMILGYKFNGNFGRTKLLAKLARKAFRRDEARMPDIVIPVPLHPRRLLKRGFNQSLEISRTLGKDLDIPILPNGLTRTRHTRPQTRLGRTARQRNIKGAFVANHAAIQDRTVLLVDDVYTTGSTLSECARTLRRTGAAEVNVLVLARAQEG